MNGAETNLEACLRVPSGPVAAMPRSAPARRRWDSPQTVWIRIDYPEWGQLLISSFTLLLFFSFIYWFLISYFFLQPCLGIVAQDSSQTKGLSAQVRAQLNRQSMKRICKPYR